MRGIITPERNGIPMRTFILSALLCILLAGSAHAKLLTADRVGEPQALLPYCTWLEDKDGTLAIGDVSTDSLLERFAPLQTIPLEGSGPVWIHLVLIKMPPPMSGSIPLTDKARLVINLGQLPQGRNEIYFSEAPGPVGAAGIWHAEGILSHEDILLPEPGLLPMSVFIRLEEMPGPWFAPVVQPEHVTRPDLLPSELLLPGLLIAAAIVCLLRALARRAQWAFWSALFLASAVCQAVMPLPAPGRGLTFADLPPLLAPGLAVVLLSHVARCMFRTDQESRGHDLLLYCCSLLGVAAALVPFVPGFGWLSRLFPLTPLLLFPLLPLCIGVLSEKRPGSLAFTGATVMPLLGAGLSLYVLFGHPLHPLAGPLAAQGGLWGMAVGGLSLALARMPRKDASPTEERDPSVEAGLILAKSAADAAKAEAEGKRLPLKKTQVFDSQIQNDEMPFLSVRTADALLQELEPTQAGPADEASDPGAGDNAFSDDEPLRVTRIDRFQNHPETAEPGVSHPDNPSVRVSPASAVAEGSDAQGIPPAAVTSHSAPDSTQADTQAGGPVRPDGPASPVGTDRPNAASAAAPGAVPTRDVGNIDDNGDIRDTAETTAAPGVPAPDTRDGAASPDRPQGARVAVAPAASSTPGSFDDTAAGESSPTRFANNAGAFPPASSPGLPALADPAIAAPRAPASAEHADDQAPLDTAPFRLAQEGSDDAPEEELHFVRIRRFDEAAPEDSAGDSGDAPAPSAPGTDGFSGPAAEQPTATWSPSREPGTGTAEAAPSGPEAGAFDQGASAAPGERKPDADAPVGPLSADPDGDAEAAASGMLPAFAGMSDSSALSDVGGKIISLVDEDFSSYTRDLMDELAGEPARHITLTPEGGYLFNLHSLVREVHDIVAPVAKTRGLIFSWFIAPSLPILLEGDAPRLRGALSLLLQNAVQASRQGAVQLAVRCRPGASSPGDLLFTINGNGSAQRPGAGFFHAWELAAKSGGSFNVDYSPADGTRISFSVRFSLPSEEAARQHLALAPVNPELADGLSGELPENAGAAFDGALAAYDPDHAPAPAASPAPGHSATPDRPADRLSDPLSAYISDHRRELLAHSDDEAPKYGGRPAHHPEPRVIAAEMTTSKRKLLAHDLQGLPYDLLHTGSNDELLELAKEGGPALYLFDGDMPEPDIVKTMAALRAITKSASGGRSPVLVLTGHESQSERLRKAGADHTLVKPFRQDDLRALVATALPPVAAAAGATEPGPEASPSKKPVRIRVGAHCTGKADTQAPAPGTPTGNETVVLPAATAAAPEGLPVPEMLVPAASAGDAAPATPSLPPRLSPTPSPDAAGTTGTAPATTVGDRQEATWSKRPVVAASVACVTAQTRPRAEERRPSAGASPSGPEDTDRLEKALAGALRPAHRPTIKVTLPPRQGVSTSDKPVASAPLAESGIAAPPAVQTAGEEPAPFDSSPDSASFADEALNAMAGVRAADIAAGRTDGLPMSQTSERPEAQAPVQPASTPAKAAEPSGYPLPGIDGEYLDVSAIPLAPGIVHALGDILREADEANTNSSTMLMQDATARLASKAEHFGLHKLGKIARCVERAAEADDMEAVATLYGDLAPVTRRYMNAIRECFQSFLDLER